MNKSFTFNKKKIKIRPANEMDADCLLSWWNDGNIMAHAGFPNGVNTTMEKVLQNISKNSDTRELLMIEVDGVSIGELNYKIDGKVADIGIKICDNQFQNGGYGTAILKQFYKTLFEQKNINKITCDTNLKNIRAQLVYESKLKMKRVKTLYNCFENQVGEKCSVSFFEISKKDFMKA